MDGRVRRLKTLLKNTFPIQMYTPYKDLFFTSDGTTLQNLLYMVDTFLQLARTP